MQLIQTMSKMDIAIVEKTPMGVNAIIANQKLTNYTNFS